MRICISFGLMLCLNAGLSAQQGSAWAGPDTSSCGDLGVTIGIATDPCPDCCYVWEPATGLSCTDCKNPTATPETATTYTVTVISEYLQWKETDQVLVDLTFGEIRFTPDHLEQGTMDKVTGELLNNQNNDPITWHFDGASLGCLLQPLGGNLVEITPGLEYGEVTIEARNTNVPGCNSRQNLPVNNGVKDVWAIDPGSPNRIARNGETLIVFDQQDVLVKAIPNEGGFANGKPDWKEDTHGSDTPLDGEDEQTMYEENLIFGNESDYIAGDDPDYAPQVKVIRKTSLPIEQDIAAGIQAYMNLIKDLLKFKGDNGDEIELPCAPLDPPIDFTEAMAVYKMKTTEVERYNHPGSATKYEATIGATFGVTGKMYHPQFTRTVHIPGFNIDICSRLYAAANSTIDMAFNTSKDPSIENDDWKLDNIQGKFSIKLFSGFILTLVTPGYSVTGSAEFSITVESVSEYQFQTKQAIATVEFKPATCTIVSSVNKLSDIGQFKKVFSGPSAEIQLMTPYKSPPVLIYDFN